MSAQVIHYSGTCPLFKAHDLIFTIGRKTTKIVKFGDLKNNQLYSNYYLQGKKQNVFEKNLEARQFTFKKAPIIGKFSITIPGVF